MKIKERYDTIMSRVERFDAHIEDKSHEDVADFYQSMFDSMQGVAAELMDQFILGCQSKKEAP